jgi:hypothetical protein
LLKKFPESNVIPSGHNAPVSVSNIDDYDDLVQGTWKLERSGIGPPTENRRESATLPVDRRVDAGRYEISISMEVHSTLIEGGRFESPACDVNETTCTWSGSSTGHLTIRGSQVQIVYDELNWTTDILTLLNAEMNGRDSRGGVLRFEKVGIQ